MTASPGPDAHSSALDASALASALATLDEARDLALIIVDAALRIELAIGGLLGERGRLAREFVGQLVEDVLPAHDAAQILPRYRAAIAGEPQHFEHRFASGNRCVIYVRATGDPPHRRATVVWRDITAQHALQAAGQRAEERYRLLAENASDIVSLRTPDGRFLWVSPSVRAVLGFEPNDLVDTYAYALGHPDDTPSAGERDARLRAGEDTGPSVLRARHADGHYRWIETTQHGIVDPATNELSTVVLTGRDVTDRVLAEQARRGVEARERTLLNTMADAAILYDARGVVVARSEMSMDLLGADDGALRLGTPQSVDGWLDVDGKPLSPDQHPAVLARSATGPLTTVLALRRPGGSCPWVRATALAIGDPERTGEVVLTLFDITQLRDASADLERSNEDLRQMALVASHDLGAPLAMLRRELDGLAGDALPRSLVPGLSRAGHAADIMQEILGAMLAYAQVDRASIEHEVVDLAAVAAEIRAILGAELETSGAVLHVAVLPTVMGDRVLLRQLLQNLVGNAITHHPGPAPSVTVRSGRRGGVPVLVVEDDGHGIPADDRASIFGLFARGTSPTAGHGIGLATAKRIVELHGGRIWFEPATPHGARFCMTLHESRASEWRSVRP